MDVVVFLSKAVICFSGVCHPVLVGADTPTGFFQLQPRQVISAGYGDDVLVFTENETTWWGIHRTYKNLPARAAAYDKPASQRRYISAGCINVQPEIYAQLIDCCSTDTLEIVP